jgi:hypothetical protein
MTLAWLLLATCVLMAALVIVQARMVNRLTERVGVLEGWALKEDPDYWADLLGREGSGPLAYEEPEPVPDCGDLGRPHVMGPSGRTCQRCPVVLA